MYSGIIYGALLATGIFALANVVIWRMLSLRFLFHQITGTKELRVTEIIELKHNYVGRTLEVFTFRCDNGISFIYLRSSGWEKEPEFVALTYLACAIFLHYEGGECLSCEKEPLGAKLVPTSVQEKFWAQSVLDACRKAAANHQQLTNT
jgi:hypothetical protein